MATGNAKEILFQVVHKSRLRTCSLTQVYMHESSAGLQASSQSLRKANFNAKSDFLKLCEMLQTSSKQNVFNKSIEVSNLHTSHKMKASKSVCSISNVLENGTHTTHRVSSQTQ